MSEMTVLPWVFGFRNGVLNLMYISYNVRKLLTALSEIVGPRSNLRFLIKIKK